MKKYAKASLLALGLTAVIALGACGEQPGQLDTDAQVNTGNAANYTLASNAQKADLDVAMASLQEDTISKYRLTLEVEIGSVTTKYNSIVGHTGTDVQLATKMTVTTTATPAVTSNLYYNEGTIAMDGVIGETSYQVKTTLPTGTQLVHTSQLSSLLTYDLDYVAGCFSDIQFVTSEEVTVKVNNEGGLNRFEIVRADVNATATVYLVFQNDTLTQCKMDMTTPISTISFSLAAYNGDIQFPDFEGYTYINYEQFDNM